MWVRQILELLGDSEDNATKFCTAYGLQVDNVRMWVRQVKELFGKILESGHYTATQINRFFSSRKTLPTKKIKFDEFGQVMELLGKIQGAMGGAGAMPGTERPSLVDTPERLKTPTCLRTFSQLGEFASGIPLNGQS